MNSENLLSDFFKEKYSQPEDRALWRGVYQDCLPLFYQPFQYLEINQLLDVDNEVGFTFGVSMSYIRPNTQQSFAKMEGCMGSSPFTYRGE